MAKLKLNPDPTFRKGVEVPVPGGSAEINCEFKYRDRDEVEAWWTKNENASAAEVVLDCVVSWDLDDELTAENVKLLCKRYPQAGHQIIHQYLRDLAGIRQGN